MQSFLETAKKGCTTLQEVTTILTRKICREQTTAQNKRVTERTAAIYQGENVGNCGQQKGSLRLGADTAEEPSSITKGPEGGR